LCTSRVEVGVQKVAESHRVRRTRAMASEKVGAGLAYQAAVRVGQVGEVWRRSVSKVTKEKRPSKSGVVR
jgi:hypothetical protein